jgi:hypothetical protein
VWQRKRTYLHDSVKDERIRDVLQRSECHLWRLLKEVFADDATESIGAGIGA